MSDTGDTTPPRNNVIRLGTEVQVAIAEGLRDWHRHIIEEGVPDHLDALLHRLSANEGNGSQ
jgi:hypothetical protein